MSTLVGSRISTSALDLAATVWHWWVGELAQLVPASIRRPFAHRRVVLDLLDDNVIVGRIVGREYSELCRISGVSGEMALPPGFPPDRDEIVVLRIPTTQILRRRLQLPLASRKRLVQLLSLDLDRHCPLDPNDIHFDFQTISRNRAARQVTIELQIVKRERVRTALATCKSMGLYPARVIAADADLNHYGPGFLSPPTHPLRHRFYRAIGPALAILTILLSCAVLAERSIRVHAEARALDAQVEQASSAARAAEALERTYHQEQARVDLLLRHRQAPTVLELIAEVTQRLPDGTWLTELDINGQELRIKGYSHAATNLIGAFDASDLFSNAEFRSPITTAPNNGPERFDLSVNVRGTPR